jgi:hypothetical protein
VQDWELCVLEWHLMISLANLSDPGFMCARFSSLLCLVVQLKVAYNSFTPLLWWWSNRQLVRCSFGLLLECWW